MTTTSSAQSMLASSAAEFVADPARFAGIHGVPPYVARRIPAWAACGMDVAAVVDVIRAGELRPGTQAWVAAFVDAGDRQVAAARLADGSLPSDVAAAAWLSASSSYFLARWPSPAPDRPDAWEAYNRHRAAYLAAARHFAHPFQVLTVPYEGREVVAYLHRSPVSSVPSPLALVCGGIDVWKSDLFIHRIVRSLLECGVDVAAVDIPGTGECPVRPGPRAARMFTAVIDHLVLHGHVASRLGFVGLSFGGHWATTIGLTDRRVAAVVNIGGPLHHAFQPSWLRRLPPATLGSLANSLGIEHDTDPDGVLSALAGMSLVSKGLLREPHRPAVLAVNGAQDEQVPIADLHLLSDYGLTQDTLIFGDDRHCASYQAPLHVPFVARWLAAQLQRHVDAARPSRIAFGATNVTTR
jgi:esterase FrsA